MMLNLVYNNSVLKKKEDIGDQLKQKEDDLEAYSLR